MTQEEKDLLLKDLCSRLPYRVKATTTLTGWDDAYLVTGYNDDEIYLDCPVYDSGDEEWDIEFVKLYLRPMSSMTEEQRKEFLSVAGYERREEDCGRHTETYYYDMVGHEHNLYPNSDAIDWLNKNHFDYRGLIEKGLAIDATGKNIY